MIKTPLKGHYITAWILCAWALQLADPNLLVLACKKG